MKNTSKKCKKKSASGGKTPYNSTSVYWYSRRRRESFLGSKILEKCVRGKKMCTGFWVFTLENEHFEVHFEVQILKIFASGGKFRTPKCIIAPPLLIAPLGPMKYSKISLSCQKWTRFLAQNALGELHSSHPFKKVIKIVPNRDST